MRGTLGPGDFFFLSSAINLPVIRYHCEALNLDHSRGGGEASTMLVGRYLCTASTDF